MHRFYCPSENIRPDTITITDRAQMHHLRNVVRLRKGEKIAVFDERAREFLARIEKISGDCVQAQIIEKRPCRQSPAYSLTVACAIPKRARMDDIVDKLTQLGVDRIIPLKTERVIVKWDKRKEAAHRLRWEAIASSASRQSQGNQVPVIEPVQDMEEVFAGARDYGIKLIPALFGERKTLREVFSEGCAGHMLVFIGPEGDFSERELELAVRNGCIPVTLGEQVLRVDTAAVSVTAFIRLYGQYAYR